MHDVTSLDFASPRYLLRTHVDYKDSVLWKLKDDGRTNQELIETLEAKKIAVTDRAREIVEATNDPVPPKGTVYRLVGIHGYEFTVEEQRTMQAVFMLGVARYYQQPSHRIGLLLREKYPTQESAEYSCIVIMTAPTFGSCGGCQYVLCLRQGQLGALPVRHDRPLLREGLFVSLAPPNLCA